MRPTTRTAVPAALVVAGLAAVGVRRRFDASVDRLADRLDDDAAAGRDAPAARAGDARADLAELPDPVRRYVEWALPADRPLASGVRLRQRGEVRLGDSWKRFEATHRATVHPPGFVWDAAVRTAPLLPTRVVDSYVRGEGRLRARLGSAVPVAAAGPDPPTNQGELLRYLAEAVWYPAALLPAAGVEWEAVDGRTARATLADRGSTATLEFRFTDAGDVREVHADRRYRREDDSYAAWTGTFGDHRVVEGVRVPFDAEVRWDDEGSYWRARVESVDFDRRPARGADG